MTRPLTVAIDVSPVRRATGGVGRYVTDLIAHLPDRSAGRPLIVLPLTNRPAAWEAWRTAEMDAASGIGIPCAAAPRPVLHRPTMLWLQAEVPARVRPPVRVAHYTTGRSALGSRTPSVVTVHDVWLLDAPEAFPLRERVLAGLWLRASIPRADRLICVSESTATAVRRRWPRAAARIAVVRPGVADRWRTAPPPLEPIVRAAVGERWWLHVGGCTARKRVDVLVEAFALALPALPGPPPALALVGPPGDRDAQVREIASRLGVAERVRWLGEMDDGALHALYAGAELTACVGQHEGFGLTALEALACGCPVVRSDRGGLPEAGQSGALVADPADARTLAAHLVTMGRDPRLRAALSDAGRRSAWSRTAEEASTATARIYVAAAAGHRDALALDG
ncbi:MAG: glycosyltransferase family 1 protein [Ardenticatenales bacterium]